MQISHIEHLRQICEYFTLQLLCAIKQYWYLKNNKNKNPLMRLPKVHREREKSCLAMDTISSTCQPSYISKISIFFFFFFFVFPTKTSKCQISYSNFWII